MEQILEYIADLLWDWPLIVIIFSTGIYYTVSCNFFQIKYFKHILKSTIFSSENRVTNNSFLSTLETFFIAVGTTSGIGNISGVATAVAIGGPGAVFWLIVTGLLGMIIKMAEVTLAVYYRDENEDGTFESGPMHYMEKGIGIEMNSGKIVGPIVLFSCGLFSTLFITTQNYYVSTTVSNVFHVDIIYVAVLYSLITYYAIIKGFKAIGRTFKVLLPIIAILYIGSGLIVILKNVDLVSPAVKAIFGGAFSGTAAFGGFVGRGVAETIRQGVSRAVYSNEAGWGTTPMIHAKANTDHPIKIGMWGAVEVFFDTILICTTTGIVMVFYGMSGNLVSGAESVADAFSLGIGSFANILIPITIFIFGLTTSIGWYAYYETIIKYANKRIKHNITPFISIVKHIYPIPGFLMVIYVQNNGIPGKTLWHYSDILAGIPTFINIFVVLILSNKFFELLDDYVTKFIKKEKVEDEIPLFYSLEEKNYYEW